MPILFADEEKRPKSRTKVATFNRGEKGLERASEVSEISVTGNDDDFWAIISKGLASTFTESLDSSEESEIPFGYFLILQGTLAIFNNALEDLALLKRIMNTPVDVSWDITVNYKTLEDRYQGSKKLVFEEGEFDKLNDIQKLQKDICFIYNILRDGYNELTAEESCEAPINAISDMFHLLDDEANLFDEYKKNLAKVEKLKETLILEKKEHLRTIQEKKIEFFALKNEYEDALVYGRYRVSYINCWEASRMQQNHHLRTSQEEEFIKIINTHNQQMEYETRVHTEVTTWLNINIDDMTMSIEYWQKHYEEERDRRDLEIYNLKTARDQLIEKLEDNKVLYEKHRIEIEEWLILRDEIRQRELLEKRQLEAAIKIQAWWRGVMVRKHLGPYRKKKKGKGKDKGKGKGKGKKKK